LKPDQIHEAIRILRKESRHWRSPTVSQVKTNERDPFRILLSTVLSLRTKDDTTGPAAERLFALASSPTEMLKVGRASIERAIYPVGFYRVKAATILNISGILVERYGSKVPADLEELLKLKGVGRKTANLVITMGFGKPGICVDTHVHRICNRWGYVSTKTPLQTEIDLRRRLPRAYWIPFNYLLVSFGQNICRPVSPFCSRCPLFHLCDRNSVISWR